MAASPVARNTTGQSETFSTISTLPEAAQICTLKAPVCNVYLICCQGCGSAIKRDNERAQTRSHLAVLFSRGVVTTRTMDLLLYRSRFLTAEEDLRSAMAGVCWFLEAPCIKLPPSVSTSFHSSAQSELLYPARSGAESVSLRLAAADDLSRAC